MKDLQPKTFSDVMEQFIAFKADKANDECEESKFCTGVGISLVALQQLKESEEGWMHEVLRRRRQAMVLRLTEVDEGLLMKARCGDTKAAEILYERLEGYIRPKTPQIVNNLQINLAGMIKNAIADRGSDNKRDIEASAKLSE